MALHAAARRMSRRLFASEGAEVRRRSVPRTKSVRSAIRSSVHGTSSPGRHSSDSTVRGSPPAATSSSSMASGWCPPSSHGAEAEGSIENGRGRVCGSNPPAFADGAAHCTLPCASRAEEGERKSWVLPSLRSGEERRRRVWPKVRPDYHCQKTKICFCLLKLSALTRRKRMLYVNYCRNHFSPAGWIAANPDPQTGDTNLLRFTSIPSETPLTPDERNKKMSVFKQY